MFFQFITMKSGIAICFESTGERGSKTVSDISAKTVPLTVLDRVKSRLPHAECGKVFFVVF